MRALALHQAHRLAVAPAQLAPQPLQQPRLQQRRQRVIQRLETRVLALTSKRSATALPRLGCLRLLPRMEMQMWMQLRTGGEQTRVQNRD